RPYLWMLNPTRVQISEYSYREGNPYIDPGYNNTYGLTVLYRQKYSLTAMYQNNDGDPDQVTTMDPENPHIGSLRPVNTERNRMYILALNAPIALTDWWQLNLNVNGIYSEAQVTADAERTYSSFVQGSMQNIFTLPRKTFFEIDYDFMSRARMASISVCPSYSVNMSLKRRMLSDKLTLSLAANNVFYKSMVATFHSGGDSRTLHEVKGSNRFHCTLSVSYHFNSGKSYKQRRVESGASDDKSRMEKNK
ncbi:MAG: TonB-dependent receptor family protein, partial [Bacteroidaceae bacterium]|nr:TonB-dependent receptor family protein [Bacteroidaceae bacterium]